MARLNAVLSQLAIVLVFIYTSHGSLLDIDYVDGMKVVHVNPSLAREAEDIFRLSQSTVGHDSLSSRARHRRASFPDKGRKLAAEYVLHGDNHSVAFIHWSGSKSQVIFIFTANYNRIHRSNVGSIYADSAYIWRSTDYGSTFQRDDVTKFTKGKKTINGIRFCKSNNRKVVTFDKTGKWLYVSKNEGESYTPYQLSFTPYDVQCHSTFDDMMLAFDALAKKLFYTKDSGANWTLLCTSVTKYFWVIGGVGSKPKQVFIEVQNSGHYHSSTLKYADLAQDPVQVKLFDPDLGNFETLSFDMQGKYMFVKKHYPSIAFYVSYNHGKFKKALFPLQLPENDYYVVDASEGEVLVCVRHFKVYNLYISDSTGTIYSLSLQRILVSSTKQWRGKRVLVDIHRVQSLRGVYLANIHFGIKRLFHTMLTFDKGGTWYPLRIPDAAQGTCVPPQCFLNLHMTHSQYYYQISGVISSQTAVGLIMAQGELGTSLSRTPDVYMSSDGGLNWKRVLQGAHDFVFLDHGGIIIAVPLRNNTQLVKYSCTEGNTWNSTTVDKGLLAYGLVTEPGEATRIANVFGQHKQQKFEWLSVKLNFTSILNQPCKNSNYIFWTPVDERIRGNCSLGEKLLYKRRKANDCCFNGRNYDVYIERTACICDDEDYMCDIGYKRDSDDKACLATDEAVLVPDPCPELNNYSKSSGYRRVPGDRCAGGQLEIDLKPVQTKCPTIAPVGLQIVIERTIVPSLTPIPFRLVQAKGSLKSTWYVWDFGDGSDAANVTSFDKARNRSHVFSNHGNYNVSVKASNEYGYTYTKIVIKVIDVIRRARIEPAHAVLVGRPADFNVTLYSDHPLHWSSEHGFVHFVWRFEDDQKPDLTWESQIMHTFAKSGKYKVTLEAINEVSRSYDSVTVTVHDQLRTLRLYFNDVLDKENKRTIEWREYFATRVLHEIARIINVPADRLEVAVYQGMSTYVDVSIIERDNNASRTMDEIMEAIRAAVSRGALEISFPDGKVAKAEYAEVITYDRYKPTKQPASDTHDTRLPIAIGVAAGVVVLFLAGVIFYVYRKYTWLYRRYHRLSNGEQLLNPMNAEAEPGLGYSSNGEGVRYTVQNTNITEDSDDELIRDIRPAGTLQVMEEEEEEPAGEETPLTTFSSTANA